MIFYRVELWCDGCDTKHHETLQANLDEVPQNRNWLITMAEFHGWAVDGGYHFCPRCQIQREGVAKLADARETLQALKSKSIQ